MLIKNEMNSTIPPIYFPESTLPLSSGTGKVPVARSLGTLRNYDGDGKGNKQKKTTLHAFLYISLPSLQQLRRDMTNFELTGERERQGNTFCSLWTRTRSPLFSSNLTSILQVTGRLGIRAKRFQIFQRGFHLRCCCRIIRSLMGGELGSRGRHGCPVLSRISRSAR